MKITFKYVLSFILCHLSFILLSQNISDEQSQTFDSLKLILKTTKSDTIKLNTLVQLSDVCKTPDILNYAQPAIELADKILKENNALILPSNILIKKAAALNNIGYYNNSEGKPDKALEYYEKSLHVYEQSGNTEGVAGALNNLGLTCKKKGKVTEALQYYNRSLKLFEETRDKKSAATCLTNIGSIYHELGDIPHALNCYNKSLKLNEEINNKLGMATTLNNIAAIYNDQKEFDKVIENNQKSLKLYTEANDKDGIALALNNIGVAHFNKGKLEIALNFYIKSFKIWKELKDARSVAGAYESMAIVYKLTHNSDSAMHYFKKCLKLRRKIDDKGGMVISLNNIGGVYLDLKDCKLASAYCDSSLMLSKELGFVRNIASAEHTLAKIDSMCNNYSGAFAHYKQYIIYRDSLLNIKTRKASIKSQLKYEFEKKEAVIKEQQEKEKIVAQEKDRFQKIVIAAVMFSLLLVVGFAFFIYRSLKTTRYQKHIIEEKQKEILDSIYYARRIQTSLLPTQKYLAKYLDRNEKS
ncbi:MAG: tetratricopeptide repeat protein [Bacteroidia bacterium]|nr:tetratricopeptide repeat protein [Bacteroidia bacterium]